MKKKFYLCELKDTNRSVAKVPKINSYLVKSKRSPAQFYSEIAALLGRKVLTADQKTIIDDAFTDFGIFLSLENSPEKHVVMSQIDQLSKRSRDLMLALRKSMDMDLFKNRNKPIPIGALVGFDDKEAMNSYIEAKYPDSFADKTWDHAFEEIERRGFKQWDELLNLVTSLERATGKYLADYPKNKPPRHKRRFEVEWFIFHLACLYKKAGKNPENRIRKAFKGHSRDPFREFVIACFEYIKPNLRPTDRSLPGHITKVLSSENYKAFCEVHTNQF